MPSNSYLRFLTGTDIFISYRWSVKAKNYALRLNEELEKRGLDCYIDEKGLPRGEDVPKALQSAIRRSRMFVLLVSDDLLDSTWVPKEITIAQESGRKIVPVNVASAIDKLPLDTKPWDAIRDRSRVEEGAEAFSDGAPAKHVAEQIDQSYTFTRRRVTAIRGLFAAGIVFFALSVGAVGSAVYAIQQSRQAEEVRKNAEAETKRLNGQAETLRGEIAQALTAKQTAETDAHNAREQKKAADGERDKALNLKATAESAAVAARVGAEKARAEQSLAERLTRRATSERLVAEARRNLERFPQKSILIALEALKATTQAGEPPLFSAQQVFIDALRRGGGRVFRRDPEHPLGESAVYSSKQSWLILDAKQKAEIWEIGPTPRLLKHVVRPEGCWGLEISPGGRWAVTSCRNEAYTYDLDSNEAEIKPLDSLSRELPRDVFNDPEARWLVARKAVPRPTHSESLARRPAANEGSTMELTKRLEQARKDGADESELFRMALDGASKSRFYEPSPDWRWIALSSNSGISHLLDPGKRYPEARWELFDTKARTGGRAALEFGGDSPFLSFSDKGRWLFTGTPDHLIQARDLLAPSGVSAPLTLAGSEVKKTRPEFKFSPDDRWVVISLDGGHHRLWGLGDRPSATPFELGKFEDLTGKKVTFSPDSRWLAVKSSRDVVSFWRLDDKTNEWKPADPVGQKEGIYDIQFSPDSRWLAAKGNSFGVKLRDLKLGDEPIFRNSTIVPNFYTLGENQKSSVFSPDSAWLLTAVYDPEEKYIGYTLWDLRQSDPTREPLRLTGIEGGPSTFSSDGHWLFFTSSQGVARIYNLHNLQTNPQEQKFTDRLAEYHASEISPDGRWLVTLGKDRPPQLWNLLADFPDADPFVLSGLSQSYGLPKHRMFSSDSRWLVTTGEQEKATLWDLRDPARPSRSVELQAGAGVLGFAPGGHFLAAAHDARTVRVWPLAGSAKADGYFDLPVNGGMVKALDFDSRARLLFALPENGEALLFDLTTGGRPSQKLTAGEWKVTGAEFAPDGRWLVTTEELTGGERRTRLWRLGNVASAVSEMSGYVPWYEFSPDSRWLLTHGTDETRLTDLRPWAALRALRLNAGKDNDLRATFGHGGRWLAIVEGEKGAELLDLRGEGIKRTNLKGHSDSPGGFYFSPDGRWLLRGSGNDAVLWDLSQPGDGRLLQGVKAPVRDPFANRTQGKVPIFSPDGRWLLAQQFGADGEPYRLWDLSASKPTLRALDGPEAIKELSPDEFTNDGHWLVGSKEGYTVFWDLRARVLTPQLYISGVGDRMSAGKTMKDGIDRYRFTQSDGFQGITSRSLTEFEDLVRLARQRAARDLTDTERIDLVLPDQPSRSNEVSRRHGPKRPSK